MNKQAYVQYCLRSPLKGNLYENTSGFLYCITIEYYVRQSAAETFVEILTKIKEIHREKYGVWVSPLDINITLLTVIN